MQQRARVTGRALALLAGRRSAGGVASAPHPWAAPAAPSTTAADRPLAPRWASTAAPAARGGDEAPTLSTPASAPFSLTPAAAARIRTLLARPASAAAGHTALRLTVEAGGCSGFSYVFGLDSTLQPGDVAVGAPDAPLVVDGVSLELVRGATVDFSSELIRQGFTVAGNPNAEGGCGCGSSFAPTGSVGGGGGGVGSGQHCGPTRVSLVLGLASPSRPLPRSTATQSPRYTRATHAAPFEARAERRARQPETLPTSTPAPTLL